MTPELVAATVGPSNAEQPPGPPPRPRLRGPDRRRDPARWRSVVPPAVIAHVIDSDVAEAHRALVERCEQAAGKVRELEAAHRQAVEQDRQAEVGFAHGERRKLPAPAAPNAEQALAQARRELELLERELPASADRLFERAHPHVEAALRELERQLGEGDERVEAAIGEALRVLDERAQLEREARWCGLALWESAIQPFDTRQRAVSNAPATSELRQVIARLRHERDDAKRKRRERLIELQVHFHADRSPKAPDGRTLGERREEAERIVDERLAREAAA